VEGSFIDKERYKCMLYSITKEGYAAVDSLHSFEGVSEM